MAIDFPNSPSVNDIYTYGGRQWQYNGEGWESYAPVQATFGFEHSSTISTSYTIPTGKNIVSAGPLTVQAGAVVTVSSGANWVVV